MQERYIATADLGTSKIAISVAKVTGDNIQIIYYKETPSDGIRYSCVFNPRNAARALKSAISQAEEELNIKILQIAVGLPRYNVHQEMAPAQINRSNPDEFISEEEVESLKRFALDTYPLTDETKEEIYGAVTQSFSVDDLINARESDIIGTTSTTLSGNFKVFVGAKKALRNIDFMLNEIGVAPARKYFLPGAVADAVLTGEEKENGVALVEIGAGVTSLTIYQGKIMRYYAAIPFGGKNITYDIKYECGFNEELAENVKLAFGACMPDKLQSLSEKIIRINDEETGTYEQLPVKYLSEIITARAKEIVNAILYLIQASGFAERLRNGVVLTGGCANLANLAGMIKEMSGYNVRPGYPRRYFSAAGCPGIGETSAVASVGMLLSASRDQYLNCIEEAGENAGQEEAQPETVEPEPVVEAPSYTGTILDPDAGMDRKPRPRPQHKPQPRQKTERKPLFTLPKVTWGNKIEGFIGKALDSDNVIGDLFDSMEK